MSKTTAKLRDTTLKGVRQTVIAMKRASYWFIVSLVFISAAGQGQENNDCSWPSSIPFAGELPGGETYTSRVVFDARPEDDLVTATETTQVDVSKVQLDFAQKVTQSDGWKELERQTSCNLRITDPSFDLSPRPPIAVGSIHLNAAAWKCVSADVPCPTWSNPLRFCRKDATTKLAGASITSQASFGLQRSNDDVKAVLIGVDTKAETSWEQRAVLDLLGASLLGVGGSVVVDAIQQQVLNEIKHRVSDGMSGMTIPNDQVPKMEGTEIPGYAPHLGDASFIDLGGGRLGVQVVRHQDKFRKGTACFLVTQFRTKAAERIAADKAAVQKTIDTTRRNACAPIESVGWKCPF